MTEEHATTIRHILIVEQNGSGHRLFYVRLLTEAALSRGDRVTVLLSPAAASAPEASVHLATGRPGINFDIGEAANAEELAARARGLGADLVVVPDGDSLAIALATRPRWNSSAVLRLLIMREKSSSTIRARRWLESAVKAILLRVANSIRNVDVVVLRSQLGGVRRGPFAKAIDPITISATRDSIQGIRNDWKLSDDRYWFAVLGAVTERKNVPLVAAALARISDAQVGLLVAGKCAPGVLEAAHHMLKSLESRGVPVVVVDRLLDDTELDSAVAASDSLVLAHSNEGPSGLLSKAAAVGTHVVASGAQSLRNDLASVPELGVWTELTAEAMSAGMRSVMKLEPARAIVSPSVDAFAAALLGRSE